MKLQRDRPHVGVEVEGGCSAAAQPLGHVLGVGQRRAEGHDSDGPVNLGGDVPHPGADDLQNGLRGRGRERERERSVRGCHAKKKNKKNPPPSTFLSYPVLSTNQVRLVHNEEADVLDVLPLLPAAGQDVPFVRRADDNVALAEQLQVSACLPCQQHHLLAQDVLELLVPVNVHLRNGGVLIN